MESERFEALMTEASRRALTATEIEELRNEVGPKAPEPAADETAGATENGGES